MLLRSLLIFLLILNSCTNKEDAAYKPTDLLDPYKSYREGLQAFEDNAYFLANQKSLVGWLPPRGKILSRCNRNVMNNFPILLIFC